MLFRALQIINLPGLWRTVYPQTRSVEPLENSIRSWLCLHVVVLQSNQAFIQDSLGNIWFGGSEIVGTVQTNSGVWRYDGVNFKNFTIKDGLSSYGVWSMFEDTAGHIWVGTRNTGLTRFDAKHFVQFSE